MSGVLYAVDPGTTHSALVVLDGMHVREAVPQYPNAELLERLYRWPGAGVALVLEQIESQGMAVGRETFETVFWTGRFYEAWCAGFRLDPLEQRGPLDRVTRKAVKLALCGQARANDANIRRAVIDLWGGDAAIGTRKHPGPLYFVKSHCWQALALAVAYRGTAALEDVPPR